PRAPGDIKSEWWARSSRNPGRDQIGTPGRDRRNPQPTVEQCRAYAAEHKLLGADLRHSARRSAVHKNISRSWTALGHQLESLAVIVKSEGKKGAVNCGPLVAA